jgi:hypothetical protein
MMELLGAFDRLKDSVGVVLAFSFLVNVFLIRLYYTERADRRSAWAAHNSILKETTEVLGQVTTSIVVLTTLVQSWKNSLPEPLTPSKPRRRALQIGDSPEDRQ